jgi:MFS family permease
VLGVLFVAHQRTTSAPVLDLDLFAIRNVAWGNLAGLVFGVAFSSMFLASILFLTQIWQWTILEAGFGIAPGPAFVALLAPRFGTLAGRIGQRPILIAGGIAYALAGVWRLAVLGPEGNYFVDYLPSMVLSGVGVACIWPQLSSVVAQALPQNRIGIGGASLQAVRQFGGTFGVALTVAFVGGASDLDAALAAFDRCWWLIVVGGFGTSLLVLPLRTRITATAAQPVLAMEA